MEDCKCAGLSQVLANVDGNTLNRNTNTANKTPLVTDKWYTRVDATADNKTTNLQHH
jgi:hypothetical protein